MLIIGEGALCTQALRFCVRAGIPVEAVLSPSDIPKPILAQLGCAFRKTANVNNEADFILNTAKDGIVWSINNRFILGSLLIDIPGIDYYNIHNGLIQACRGLPEISIFFALLNGDGHYGATLHRIDHGIDTGPIIAQKLFPILPSDTFATVMRKSLASCAELFEENCHLVAAGSLQFINVDRSCSKYYSYKMLPSALAFRSSTNWSRATDLGAFRGFFPRLSSWLNENAG